MPSKTFSVDFETSGFRKASRQMSKMGDEADDASGDLQSMGKAGKTAITAIGTAVAAAVAGIGKLVSSTSEYADTIDKAAERTGIAREEMQRLKFAAEQSGSNIEALESTASSFARRISRIEAGSGQAADAFNALGVSLRDSSGELRDQGDIYNDVLRSLAEMDNATRRASIGSQLFGRQFSELQPLLNQGADGIDNLRQQADELGIVMGEDNVKAFTALKDQYNAFKSRLQGVGRELASSFLPLVSGKVIPALTSWTESTRDVIEGLTSMSDTTKGIIATVTGLTAAVSAGLAVWAAWPALVAAVTTAFGGLTAAATTAWTVITSPITGVIAAIAAVAAAAGLIYDNWAAISDFFEALFNGVVSVTKIAGQQIAARFEQAWLQVRKIFAQSINGLISLINEGLAAIGAEDMQISGEVGVPSQALEQNRNRLAKLQEDMDQATSKANEAVNTAGSNMMAGFTESVRSAYDEVKGLMGDIGGFFSVDAPQAQQQQNQQTTTTSGGGGGDGSSASAGQEETLIEQVMPNLNQELDLAQDKMTTMQEAGRQATSALSRGFNRVASGIGSAVTNLIAGGEAAKSFGKTMVGVLKQVLRQLVALIPKLTIIAAIKSIAGISSGGITSIGGALTAAIPGLAQGGIVTGPTMAMIGEGTENEAVMPLSKLDKMMQGGGRGGGAVQSAGSARVSQGTIEIPVEVVDEAQRKGARRSTRTGRR